MEIFYIIFEILIIVAIIISYLLDKKQSELIDEMIEDNNYLANINIELMKKEVKLKAIFNEAEETKEDSKITVQKIKELFTDGNQDK